LRSCDACGNVAAQASRFVTAALTRIGRRSVADVPTTCWPERRPGLDVVEPAAITAANLKRALELIRQGRDPSPSGLLSLHVVGAHQARLLESDSAADRAEALADLLREIVVRELAAVRGEGAPARDTLQTRAEAAALLARDYAADDPAREAWSALYYRYFDPHGFQIQQIATITQPGGADPRRRINRRLHGGVLALVQLLRQMEREAVGAPERREAPVRAESLGAAEARQPSAPTRATIRGDGGQTLAALLTAVQRNEDVVPLSPATARELARRQPGDLIDYRFGRIAEWSQERYRLDRRFVELTLLIDRGEDAPQGRWQAKEQPYDDLRTLIDAVPDPAVVLLGPPGSGKSTLLRHFELECAKDALRNPDTAATVTFFIQLNRYQADRPGDQPLAAGEWLAERWAERFPALPALDSLLAEGRMVLLLDALNETPAASEREFSEHVRRWRQWLQAIATGPPGNRVVFSCRTLDYSQPLSSPDLRVPQVQIEPLTDEKVREFLDLYSPTRSDDIWQALAGSPQLDVFRSPYFLSLLVAQVEASGEVPRDRAALFTGFVRRALRREVERGGPPFEAGQLLDRRDLRRITRWRWQTPCDLPDRGPLVPGLARLAYQMQSSRSDGERSQVRVDYDDALGLLADDQAEAIVAAGTALGVLDEDEVAAQLMFVHQLVQEYFAGRQLAAQADPELVRVEWRADQVSPTVDDVIHSLAPADALPMLPQTGWEETTLLAAAMTDGPAAMVQGVMDANLALAGRIAAQAEVRARLPETLLDELRWALVHRSRDPEADLRDRIACGYAVGDLGDPRYERRIGPYGDYLWPPMVEIPGGVYPIGDGEPIEWTYPYTGETGTETQHMPRHDVAIAPFRIGRFPLTNAEWACFITGGGYVEERWWDTADARRWRRGELPNVGAKNKARAWRRRFKDDSTVFARRVEENTFHNESEIECWRRWLALDDDAFERALDVHCRLERRTEPAYWLDERYNRASQPAVGVCWYEARAYCNWLSAQSGLFVRLSTEVEWEAVARGRTARAYPWGDTFDCLKANTHDTHVRRPTPVGVFPGGDTPETVADLAGNVSEWTSSTGWARHTAAELEEPYGYPYDGSDGREDAVALPSAVRVSRGGSWWLSHPFARAAWRNGEISGYARADFGLRLVAPES
jgi:formylglycine-generating enzyme required for sulfatase activity